MLKVWWDMICVFIKNLTVFLAEWWKNVEDQLRYDEVATMSCFSVFLVHSVLLTGVQTNVSPSLEQEPAIRPPSWLTYGALISV